MKKMIPFTKLVSLLVCVLGVGSAMAAWDGVTKTPARDTTINKTKYYLIENEENLAWFADSANRQAVNEKWNYLVDQINKLSLTDEKKAEAISLMEKIQQDALSYYKDEEKRALWSPYENLLKNARGRAVNITMNAFITANYLDMGNKPFFPIAAGTGAVEYKGTFDGNWVTIKNLEVNSDYFPMYFYDVVLGYPTYCQNVGLFGAVGGSGVIKHVVLDNVTIWATGKNGLWSNDHQVSVGAIAGWLDGGRIDSSYAAGSIQTNGKDVGVGGLVGAMRGGSINNSLSAMHEIASGEDVYVGGIVGVVRGNSTISYSAYDGEHLQAAPDSGGSQGEGGISGRVTSGSSLALQQVLFDSDIKSDGLGKVESNVKLDPELYEGNADINTAEYACLLNQGTWADGVCTGAKSTIWTNGDNVTNNGVSKDGNGHTVYLVQFDANGGSFAEGAKTYKFLQLEHVITADEISVPQYGSEEKVFGGWALTENATEPTEVLGKVYKPMKIYAYWRETFEISFDPGEAKGKLSGASSDVQTVRIPKDAVVSDEGIVKLTSYDNGGKLRYFEGWSETESGSVIKDFGQATGPKSTEAKTFYAKWTDAPTYTVTFDVDGYGETPQSIQVQESEKVTKPIDPEVAGWTFMGWFKDGVAFDFDTPIMEPTTLKAKWNKESYTISYKDADVSKDPDYPKSYDVETETIVLKHPTKDGFVFDNWYYDSEYTNVATQISQGTTGNITLYAKWEVKQYTITYIAGKHGIGNVEASIKNHGEAINLKGVSYIRFDAKDTKGYIQNGWATEEGGDIVYALGAKYETDADISLYPHWGEAVTIKISGSSYTYDGKKHGATVEVTGLDKDKYKVVAETDSIQNVGEISAKLKSLKIVDNKGNDMTSSFTLNEVVSDAVVSVTKRNASFVVKDISATYTGTEISRNDKVPANLATGHNHNVFYTVSGKEAGTYPGTVTELKNVKITDADGNDVTSNYDVSVTPPTTGLTIAQSAKSFELDFVDEYVLYDKQPHAIQKPAIAHAPSGETEILYQMENSSVWTPDLSSLTQTAVGTYVVYAKATNPNYSKPSMTNATLVIVDSPEELIPEIVVAWYGDNGTDSLHVSVPKAALGNEKTIKKRINRDIFERDITPYKTATEDSTYEFTREWNKIDEKEYVAMFESEVRYTSIVIKYGRTNEDTAHAELMAPHLRDEALTNNDINSALLDRNLSRYVVKPEDDDSTYALEGWKKNPTSNMYEPVFKGEVKMTEIAVKYGDASNEITFVDIPNFAFRSEEVLNKSITEAVEAEGITIRKVSSDPEFYYYFTGAWETDIYAGADIYKPVFELRSNKREIVVKYGDSDLDTLHLMVHVTDSESVVLEAIDDKLKFREIEPSKASDSTYTYKFEKFVWNEELGIYEGSYEKIARVFNVNFNLPQEGRLTAKFNGYTYGKVTMLPSGYIKGDTTWEFKGWYQKKNGLGERYKAMLATDYGDKDVYPLFQKTIRYDAHGETGEIVVIYSGSAEKTIDRALSGVIPADYKKGKVTYTFDQWELKDGVYKASFVDAATGLRDSRSVGFAVATSGRALEISGARIGSKVMVYDLQGVLVARDVIADGTRRIELPRSGSYVVRINRQALRVNVE